MANCTISIWGNPNGRGYIVNGRESDLMTFADCNIRNIDGDSVFQGEFYSVMYTDRGYIISYHYTLRDEGMIASEFGGFINFRDPRTVISIAVPRGCTLDGPVEIFDKIRDEYYNVIAKLITIDELSGRVSKVLPEWEELVSRNIVKGATALRVNTKDERSKGVVVYQNLDDVSSYLVTLERQMYKGNKLIYFVPQTSASFFAGVPAIYAPVSFVPSYRVVFPDNTVREISSLEEPIDVTVTVPNHEDMHLQGTVAAKMTEWCISPSEDCSEYVIGVRPSPMKKIVLIDCTDLGTGLPKSELSMLMPSVGHIEGSVLVLTGDEIDKADSAFNITVLAPYRRVDFRKETQADGSAVIKVQIIQRVSFNADEYIRRITSSYGFSPEIYCNGARVYGIIEKDITEARRCRITIKGSEDYEEYEMDMPLDNHLAAINLKKREGREITFEVRGAEAQEALKYGAKIEVYSSADEDGDGKKGGKKGEPQQKPSGRPAPKLKSHRFFLSSHQMEEKFDPSFLSSEREYKATMKGFKPFSFKLPKRMPTHPIELVFKPTVGTQFKKNKGWIALIVLAFLLGCGAGFGLKFLLEKVQEDRAVAEELAEAKTKLVALSNKLTDVDFTSTDVQNLQTFIKEHEELKGASEVETAETRIKMAESILDLCSGNDAALDALLNNTALSENQKKLLRDIKEMPELGQVGQNSASLENLKEELDEKRTSDAAAIADADAKKAEFTRLCVNLSSLECTIDELTAIIDYAEQNGFKNDIRYTYACNLKVCICAMMGKNTKGGQLLKDAALAEIDKRINKVPKDASSFMNSLRANSTACDALPLSKNCKSLQQIKAEINKSTGVAL